MVTERRTLLEKHHRNGADWILAARKREELEMTWSFQVWGAERGIPLTEMGAEEGEQM